MTSFRAIVGAEAGGHTVVLADTLTGVSVPDDRMDTAAFLASLFSGDDDSVLVGWDIDASVNCLMTDLPEMERIRLFCSLDAEFGPYRLLYVPHMFLSVSRWDRGWGGSSHRPARATRTLYDLSSFWPGRRGELGQIARQWGIPYPSVASAGDAARPYEFDGWTRPSMAEWADTRANIVSYLATMLAAGLERVGVNLKRWHGVGAIGTEILKSANGPQWIAHYNPSRQPVIDDVELLPIFQRAYYGGRIETTLAGTLDGPLWRLDMRSAYAWALSWVGAVGFKWNHVTTFDPSPAARMAVYRVEWNTPDAFVCPFPYREHGRSQRGTAYPRYGNGWYWWPEVRAALAMFGPEQIKVHEGYVSPGSSLRPLLSSMATWYTTRRELDAEHDPLVDVVKGGVNAVYGKLIQSISTNGRPGRFYNPALAGWVCSAVRAKVLAVSGGNDSRTAAIMTDGLLMGEEPPPAMLTDDLGGWRAERYERAQIIIPGMYRLHRADGTFATATTGVNRGVDFDWLLAELTARGRADIRGRWFVPHTLADQQPGRWERVRCRWQDSGGQINPDHLARKRVGGVLPPGFDWRSQVQVLGPHATIDAQLSAAYVGPPAWQPRGFDPLFHAYRSALRDAS